MVNPSFFLLKRVASSPIGSSAVAAARILENFCVGGTEKQSFINFEGGVRIALKKYKTLLF